MPELPFSHSLKLEEIAKISREESFEFDENELKKYLNEVIKVKSFS